MPASRQLLPIILSLACLPAMGQQWRALPVRVIDAYVNPAQPVKHVRLRLGTVRGMEVISQGVSLTNDKGKASLELDADSLGGAELQVSLFPGDAPGLVIYDPAGGIVNGLPAQLTLKLLPRGSPALLGPSQIEALLFKFTQTNQSLRTENTILQGKLAVAGEKLAATNRAKEQLEAAQVEWAEQYGFTLEDVKEKVNAWADQVRAEQASATLRQQMLAALAKGDFDETIHLAQQGEAESCTVLDAGQQAYLEALRKNLSRQSEFAETEAKAQQAKLQYGLAAAALARVASRASQELARYPEDKELGSIWVTAVGESSIAELTESEFADPPKVQELITSAIANFQTLLARIKLPEDRAIWASTQENLGTAYLDLSQSSSGPKATVLFVKAVEAFHHALEVDTKAEFPQDWAIAQVNLGDADFYLSERSSGAAVEDMLAEAVDSYLHALEVYTKTDNPEDWATTQTNLGNTYREQGRLSSGLKAKDLFTKAVEAYRHALEIRTKADRPQDWAATQTSLGITYRFLSDRSSGAEAKDLFAKAVEAYQNVLEVTSRADLPQTWAANQINLGNAYLGQGERSSGADAKDLFAKAAGAYQGALGIYTKADLPQNWAGAQMSFGNALIQQAESLRGEEGQGLESQAVDAYNHALEVFTEAELPQDWALTQMNLGNAYLKQGQRTSGTEAMGLFTKSVVAFHHALDVYTKTDLPQDWARTQINLGTVLAFEAEQSSGAETTDLFAKAVEAYRHALEVYTKADWPEDWAITQKKLGRTLSHESSRAARSDAGGLEAQAVEAYRHVLEVRTKSDEPEEWGATQLNIGLELFHEAELADQPTEQNLLSQAAEALHSALEVFTRTNNPQEWGSIEGILLSEYHDRTFNFSQARVSAEDALSAYPESIDVRLLAMEAELTDEKYSSCLGQPAFLVGKTLSGTQTSVMHALYSACLWGAKKFPELRLAVKLLLADKDNIDNANWTSIGDRHFFATSLDFAQGRGEWDSLFAALEQHDPNAWGKAVESLGAALQRGQD